MKEGEYPACSFCRSETTQQMFKADQVLRRASNQRCCALWSQRAFLCFKVHPLSPKAENQAVNQAPMTLAFSRQYSRTRGTFGSM